LDHPFKKNTPHTCSTTQDLALRAQRQEERNARRVRGQIASSPDDNGVLALSEYEVQIATLKDHFRDIYILGDTMLDLVHFSLKK